MKTAGRATDGRSKEHSKKNGTTAERNEEINNPTTSLTNMEQEKNTERKETIIRVLISVDGTEQYLHSDVRISCPAPYLVKGDIAVRRRLAQNSVCQNGCSLGRQLLWKHRTQCH